MREKFVSILLSPVSIALVLTAIIALFLPKNLFKKYELELEEENVITSVETPHFVDFKDIDNDGFAERIHSFNNTKGFASVLIRMDESTLLDQWNFEGKLLYDVSRVSFFDIDKNDTLEILFLTLNPEGIELNILRPYEDHPITKRLILRDLNNDFDRMDIMPGHMVSSDLNGDGYDEIIFTINGGYSAFPRNAFSFDLKNDTVYTSPFLCNTSTITEIGDFNNDGRKEVLLHQYSANNQVTAENWGCTDSNTYFTILDYELNFLYEPKEYECLYAGVEPSFINYSDSFFYLGLLNSRRLDNCANRLMFFTKDFDLSFSKDLTNGFYILLGELDKNPVFYDKVGGGVFKLKLNFSLEEMARLDSYMIIHKIEKQKNDNPAWIAISKGANTFHLYQENFSHQVTGEIKSDEYEPVRYGFIRNKNENLKLYIQKAGFYYIYEYFLSPLYPFRFLTYPGIFLFFLGIVFLGNRGQKIRERKKREIEQEIAELQLKSIKNQVDPHFVFNAINTISAMMLEEDKESADRFITKFAKLMRQTLRGSDKISTRLMDELEYIENYIQLQQIRYEHRFEFTINIDPDVDLYRKIPKHVLFTYVENAIKHGLAHKEDKGFLSVDVLQTEGRLRLVVEDNGIGEKAKLIDNPYSSGRGMNIMEQIFSLYQRIHKTRIKYQAIPLKDSDGEPSGMRVQIDFEK